MKEKRCTKCGEIYPETNEYFYYYNKSKKEKGFLSWCKKCMSLRATKYQKADHNRYRKHQDNWYKDNKERKSELNREWYQENKEKRREYIKNYYKENKEKFALYGKQKKFHKQHKISDKEWEECKLYFDNSCAYCGKSWDQNYQEHKQDLCKDHFDNSGRDDLTNCIPACKNCNSTKTYKDVEDFYNEENENFSEKRLSKIFKWLSEDCYEYLDR